MNPTIVGMIVFTCTFGGALLGMWVSSTLPEHHLDAESKDTVKVGIGLIAMMTALLLDLVTVSAKSSFDDVESAVKETALHVLSLGRTLARYGSETSEIRKGLQSAVGTRIDLSLVIMFQSKVDKISLKKVLVERSGKYDRQKGEEVCMSVQLIPVSQRKARSFMPNQKLQILKEWELTATVWK
jgi:hypothetical protein